MSYVARVLNFACIVATAKKDDRVYKHGAVGIRKDGAMVTARNGNPKEPDPYHHCERRLVRKLDKGSRVYLARSLADGTWANSKPCYSCEVALVSAGVRKIFYTIGPQEYGTIEF